MARQFRRQPAREGEPAHLEISYGTKDRIDEDKWSIALDPSVRGNRHRVAGSDAQEEIPGTCVINGGKR